MTAVNSVDVFCDAPERQPAADHYAQIIGCELNRASDAGYQLWFGRDEVYLRSAAEKKHGVIRVDFCAGGAAHRRLYGGGKGQMIAKAVGLTAKIKPSVLDATAGLGGDAFVLACLGCQVTMMERSPVAFALLQDGLARARQFAMREDDELAGIISRMHLVPGNSIEWMRQEKDGVVDVIYLDPMFPERQKSAAVKKEMQAFHQVIGQDMDDDQLLAAALSKARFRVVVKRPRHAPPIAGAEVTYTLDGKSSRFDIYALRSIVGAAFC